MMGVTINPSDEDQMNHAVDQPLSICACDDDTFDYNYYADQEYFPQSRKRCTKLVDYYSLPPPTAAASENYAYYKDPILTVENVIANQSNRRRRRGRSTAATITRSCEDTEEEKETRGGDLVVITRPKGGRKPICMDLDEVKACRDLGFELEHDPRFFDTVPSFSATTSNPGDVKARLKVWAQAVALASSSSHHVSAACDSSCLQSYTCP